MLRKPRLKVNKQRARCIVLVVDGGNDTRGELTADEQEKDWDRVIQRLEDAVMSGGFFVSFLRWQKLPLFHGAALGFPLPGGWECAMRVCPCGAIHRRFSLLGWTRKSPVCIEGGFSVWWPVMFHLHRHQGGLRKDEATNKGLV